MRLGTKMYGEAYSNSAYLSVFVLHSMRKRGLTYFSAKAFASLFFPSALVRSNV